jgi:hypothetical protein
MLYRSVFNGRYFLAILDLAYDSFVGVTESKLVVKYVGFVDSYTPCDFLRLHATK